MGDEVGADMNRESFMSIDDAEADPTPAFGREEKSEIEGRESLGGIPKTATMSRGATFDESELNKGILIHSL